MFKSFEKEYNAARREVESLTAQLEKSRRLADQREEEAQLLLERTIVKHKDELARVTANVDTKIAETTNELAKKVAKLETEKTVALEKVAMYEKAFENLGFDVKDMKEILNKLVDGVVSKNQIQMISQNSK